MFTANEMAQEGPKAVLAVAMRPQFGKDSKRGLKGCGRNETNS